MDVTIETNYNYRILPQMRMAVKSRLYGAGTVTTFSADLQGVMLQPSEVSGAFHITNSYWLLAVSSFNKKLFLPY